MRRYRSAAAAIAVWSLLTVLHGLFLVGFAGTDPAHAFAIATGAMGAGGLLTLGLWLVSTRWVLPRRFTPGFFIRHGVSAVAFGTIWVIALILVSTAFSDETVLDRVARLMGWEFLAGVWLYASVVGFAYARRAAARLREKELSEVRARLAALQAQMSPHFLFNALNTVSGLIDEDPGAAEEAIEHLAELLRYSMDDGSNGSVTLADEWAFTQRFLAIAKLRFGERLTVSSQIEPAALACRLPALTLQPLVENAVRHGIAGCVDGGTITIAARRDRGDLLISVEDTGSDTPGDAGRGLGLGGLGERLHLHFGDAASVRVASPSSRGFQVQIVVPCTTVT